MSIVEYWYALRKRWLAILILAILGAVGGLVMAQLTPDLYRSTGRVLIASDRGDTTSELTQGATFVQATIPSYVVLATSDMVLDPVIAKLDLETTPRQLASLVTASTPLGTSVIDIAVTHGNPERAQQIAGAVVDSLSAAIPQVSPHSEEGRPSVTARTIQPASLPRFAIAPNTRLYIALGALAGLGLGVVYALGRRLFGDHISGPRDVAQLSDVPVLGQIIESKRNATLAQLVLEDPLSPEAESVRALAANLNFLRVDGGLRSLVITSSDQGEGKSTIALALALIVAESGKRVLLVDADLRRPSIAQATMLEEAVGLTGVLLGEIELADACEQWGVPGLTVLTSGPVPPNPSQLISSDAMKKLIDTSEGEYDLVILDTGPVLSVADAIWLSHASGGALMVARWGKTSRHHFARSLHDLERADSKVLGIVLTRKPRRGAARYEYTGAGNPASHERDGAVRNSSPRTSGGSRRAASRGGGRSQSLQGQTSTDA